MNRFSLTSRITLLLVLASGLLAVGMSLTVYQLLASNYEALVAEREQAKIERLVAEVELIQQQRLLSLEAFSARIVNEDGELLSPMLLQSVLQRPSVASAQFPGGLLVFDASATAIAERDFVPDRLGTNYADRLHFQRAMESKRPVISEPILGRVTGLPILSYLHPILNMEGNIIAFVGGTLDLSKTPLIPSDRLQDEESLSSTLIIDRQNRLFVTMQERFTEPQALPATGTDELVDAAMALKPSGTVVFHQGTRYVIATQEFTDLGWTALRAIPYDQVIAPAKATYKRFLALSLISILLITTGAALIARKLTRPLAQMTQRVSDMAKTSRFESNLSTDGGPEIASLARAMNRLANERNAAEATAHQTEKFLSNLLESASEMSIIATNPAGIITVFNKGAESLLGYTKADMVNKQTPAVFHLESEVIARAQVLSDELGKPIEGFKTFVVTAEREGSETREWTYVHKSGRHITVSLAVTVVRNDDGSVAGYLGIAQDITVRKRMEQMKSEFISTVSHELRTPLTSISGALGLVVDGRLGELPEKVNHLLRTAHRNSKRLAHLINDLLDIEKIASGKLHFNMQEQPLKPLILQAIEANEALGASRSVSLDFLDRAKNDLLVRVDDQRLMQVLANLLSNAIKFSPDHGTVTVDLDVNDGEVVVSVQDQGPGISLSFRDKIFQRFAQADASDTRAKEGTGLGLAISRELVEHMSGSIGFESTEGQGSRFFFQLPRVTRSTKENNTSTIRVDSPALHARILVVEDDPDVAHLLSIMLKNAGYESDIAYRGNDALRMLEEAHFDLVCLDLMLPDISGLDIIHQLRGNPRTIDLPIVVVSAKIEQGKLEVDGDVSHIDWLAKPIDQYRLIDLIDQQLAAAIEQPPRVLHVEDDKDLHSVIVAMAGDKVDMHFATSLKDARHQLQTQVFDTILLDIELPDGSGWNLVPEVRATCPKTKIIILSGAELSTTQRAKVEAVLLKSKLTANALLEGIKDRIQWHQSRRAR
ncbi:Sensory box histidine kinase/response regulator [Nitrincola lacisaponensis]|uniref:histidine kinase n=1 Tax=Nitrincola lacisaponensis TaxID=267850 RepID=A0A063Y9L4_9GAMM|nr:response regulator [Nitrincola lacisaponensis]KDE41012.1 Sensory box histidine kinase/response regulator [Nitrincola lacisaponensis]